MTRDEMIQQIEILEEIARRRELNRFSDMYHSFYAWQLDFIRSTSEYTETALIAANRVGKTYTGTWLDACHLTGDYPDGFDGHKFNHAPLCWALGVTGDKARDLLQLPIFGQLIDGKFSGGLVPAESIIDYIPSGTSRLANTVFVRHKSGGTSKMQFFSYSQGQHVLMGDNVDWFHIDEEPKDQTIRPQVLTRITTGDKGRGGRGIYTFTPENGRTDTVINFMDEPKRSQKCLNVGWDDVEHITPKMKDDLLAAFPAHQRDMRTKGIPMLGHGRIYDLAEEFISVEPFPIPSHWFVIGGMDFGWDHPQAQVRLVEDRDNGVFYVTNAWKERHVSPDNAWGSVKSWQSHVPIAWPHDGLQTEKGSGKQQMKYYSDAGFNMLRDKAEWPDGSNGVEAGIFEIRDLMAKGKFKVFNGCRAIFDEFLMYHRDDKGKISKTKDDALDAMRYAYMMRRHAVQFGELGKEPKEIDINALHAMSSRSW